MGLLARESTRATEEEERVRDVDTSLGVCVTPQGNKKPKKKHTFLRSFLDSKGRRKKKMTNRSTCPFQKAKR